MMKKNGMCFAGVRAPEHDQIGLLDFGVGRSASTSSKDCRQTDDARSVSSPVAGVDVVRAEDGASELLRRKVHLVGRLRAAEHANSFRAMLLDNATQA